MDNSTNIAVFLVAGMLIAIFASVIGLALIIVALGGLQSISMTTAAEDVQVAKFVPSDKAAVIATLTAIPPRPMDFSRANPEWGEELFNTFQSDAGFACATCHRVDSEDRLIGPGLLNISSRATTRVNGLESIDYIRESITKPRAYVVEGYPDNLMPLNWVQIYDEREINHIIAYLLTLESDSSEVVNVVDEVNTTLEIAILSDEELIGGDAANGEALFNTFQPDAGFACATCHRANSEDRLIGPGLLNVSSRAETRVDGLSALQYIYVSVTNPDAYVVDGFPDSLMPENWAEIYSIDEIRDIMAYLMTLQ